MITLLSGDNEFAILQKQNRIIADYLGEHDAFGLERLDGEDLEPARLRDAVLQLPFLVNKKLVVVSKAFATKEIAELLLELLQSIPDDIDLVLVDTKADKRTKLYKELASSKLVSEFINIKGSALERWVADYAEECGSSITDTDAKYLIDRVGADQMLLAREIEKLAYGAKIDRLEIDDLTDQSLNGSVFDLLDKTFAGKKAEALKMYDDLLAGKTDPAEILSLIGWQLHVLALVKYAGQGSPSDIAKSTNLHPFVIGKAMNVIRSLSTSQIKQGITTALDIDLMIKTSTTDPADAVKVLLLELSA